MRINIKAVLFLALVLRLVWLILVDTHPVSDSGVYDDFAVSIVEGRGFAFADGTLTAFWPVGTSAVYALIYKVLGHNYLYIAWLNLLLGIGIVYLSWSLSRHYFDEKTALLTAFILAVWPLLIQFTSVLASELIFVFMMLLIIRLANSISLGLVVQAILFGVAIGLTCHIRPTIAPLLLILPALQLIKRQKTLSQLVPYVGIALISCALVMTPWSMRNTELYGQTTLLTTNFGPNFWMGNNPDSDGAYMRLPQRPFANEKVRDNELKQEAIEFIKNNPGQYVLLAVKRMGHTFSRETIGIVWNEVGLAKFVSDRGIYYLKLVSTLFWYVALIVSIIGVIVYLCRHRWHTLLFTPFVLIGYFVSIPLLTVGQDRYHIPMIPFIACFFAYALIWFSECLKKSRSEGV